jgi:multiple sugar transport system permease protein
MVVSSLKSQLQNLATPPLFWFSPTLDNYRTVFRENPFFTFMFNSLLVGLGATLLGLVFGLPAAYSIARYKHRKVAFAVLITRITPGISYLVPWFVMFSQLHLVGTYHALILSHLTVSLPMIIWIMIGFFEDVPIELEDAAAVDGCSRAGIFWRVCLPLVKPGIATAAILSFIMSWNNFLYSAVLSGDETRTMPVAVFGFLSFGAFDWGALTAAATMITLPVLVLAVIIQRHIIAGLSFGAVKG